MSPVAAQTMLPQRRIPLLDILPPSVRLHLGGREVCSERMAVVALPAPIRRFVRMPERIGPAEFAARHRRVTDGSRVGPWRREYAAHTVKIMDTFGLPWVREVWYCGVDQSGKTMTLTNCLAWSIEHLTGDIFYLMPSEETAKNIVAQKLRPMLEQSPHLRRFLSPVKDDTGITRIRLRNGKTIRPSWASSPLAMATWSAQSYFCDEIDKFSFLSATMGGKNFDAEDRPAQGGKETDPITAIRRRARIFQGREKGFFASTPAGRFIVRGVRACHQVWEMRVRCPHCQELIRLDEEHLVLDEAATVEQVEVRGCGYACNACGVVWTNEDRLRAIDAGAWVAVKGGDAGRPARVGFVHRAWECRDVSLTEIGVAWLKKQGGRLADKIAWANGIEADDYHHEQVDREEDFILRLVDPSLPRGAVPADASCLLLLVDTQKYGFRYQVWACGFGEHLPVAVIDRGFVHKFSHLADLAAKEWHDAAGAVHRIHAAWIDSGGGTDPHRPKHSRTQAVYLFCKKNPLFQPLKGRRHQAQPWGITRIDYMPSRAGKKIAIAGGLDLYTINVTLYKGELATTLEVEPGDPGAMRLFAGIGPKYAAEMCAEYRDEQGWWICPRNRDNHDWDLSVYGFAAIDIMGIRNWQREPEPLPEAVPPPQRRRRW